MAEEESPENKESDAPDSPPPASPSRRQRITPELRRFLNQSRSSATEPSVTKQEPVIAAPEKTSAQPPSSKPRSERRVPEQNLPRHAEPSRSAPAQVLQTDKSSRIIEIQTAVLILGAILLLGLSFYGGIKFNYIRYLMASRNKPSLTAAIPKQLRAIPPEDLVRQGLIAEKAGRWRDAIKDLMAAKRKNLSYRGILFRVAEIYYEHRDFDSADKALADAIAFGENVDAATFYRGLIAARRRDLPAAEQFLQSAVTDSPFVPDYQYYCAEVFRLDMKPEEAIPYYSRAELLAHREQDSVVCQFKIRLARIEAAEGAAVADEVAKKASAGPLSVDWLLTSAALDLRDGHVTQAYDAIARARDRGESGLFMSCINDFSFQDAAKTFPELAGLLHLDPGMQSQLSQ